jgi:O-antigen/teichoic acid export membrane protein
VNSRSNATVRSTNQPSAGSLLKVGVESLETAGAQVLGILISIPMLAITARWLGPEGRGAFVTSTTWSALAATCCGLSLGMVAIHEMTKTSGRELQRLLGTLLALTTLVSVVAWIAVAGLFRFDRSAFGTMIPQWLVLAFSGIPFLVARDYLGSLLIADGRVTIWNRAQSAAVVLSFALVGLFALLGTLSVELVILAWLVGQLLVCLVAYITLYRSAGGIGIDFGVAAYLLRGGYKLHLNAVGAILISSLDVLMVNSYVGVHEVANYQLAIKLVTNVSLIAQAVGVVSYGTVVKMGPDDAWILVRRICAITMALIMLGSLVAAWLAPLIVSLIAGPAFAPSVRYFRLMLIAVPGLSLSALMAPQWICRGFFWTSSILTCAVAGMRWAMCCLSPGMARWVPS